MTEAYTSSTNNFSPSKIGMAVLIRVFVDYFWGKYVITESEFVPNQWFNYAEYNQVAIGGPNNRQDRILWLLIYHVRMLNLNFLQQYFGNMLLCLRCLMDLPVALRHIH